MKQVLYDALVDGALKLRYEELIGKGVRLHMCKTEGIVFIPPVIAFWDGLSVQPVDENIN